MIAVPPTMAVSMVSFVQVFCQIIHLELQREVHQSDRSCSQKSAHIRANVLILVHNVKRL
jgi:hypothetical protein